MSERFEIYTEILEGMAKILFMEKMADELEEMEHHIGGGQDYANYIGETPTPALYMASEIIGRLEHANNGVSVVDLYHQALEADDIVDSSELRSRFGSDLAMQSLGHGVSWFDNHEQFDLKFPFYVENNIDIGKDDFDAFSGFDKESLSDEALARYEEAPEKSSYHAFPFKDKAVGIAKAFIMDANAHNPGSKQVALDTLLVNVSQSVPAMCLAYQIAGGMSEANRTTLYQLTLNNVASEGLEDRYKLTDLDVKKLGDANKNDVQLGMLIYDWAVKGKEVHQLIGYRKPEVSLVGLEGIKPSIERKADLGNGLSR